jgi:YidC/Oxa1 family membrane protein insertase
MSFLNPIFKVLGQFLMLLYTWTHSYVLAIVIFTILVKTILFPLSLKSKKSMMKTQALQGKMQQLQKQYGKDKERYNQEVQKLYEKEGVNPMGGCLWSLIPLPILWGVYAVVRRPLFFMYNLTSEQVTAVQEAVENVCGTISGSSTYLEMKVANLLNTDSSALEAAKSALGDAADKLSTTINFHFLGINLADTPTLKFWQNGWTWNNIGLFLIPILVAAVSLVSSIVTQKTNAMTREDENKPADASTKSMLIMMPLMYLWFGFIMPAGMCVYMMISVVLQMVQDKVASRVLRSKFAEMRAQQEEKERLEKEEEKRLRAERIEQKKKEEEEAKKKRKKNAAAASAKKDKGPTTDKGAVGIRRYALGRNYEPDRFGGVTPYKDPTVIIDEAAVEAALAKKKGKKAAQEEPETETLELTQETVQEEVVSEAEAPEEVETQEAVEESAETEVSQDEEE